jgi:hypothetical protein
MTEKKPMWFGVLFNLCIAFGAIVGFTLLIVLCQLWVFKVLIPLTQWASS